MNLAHELISPLVSIKPRTGLVRHKVDTPKILILNMTSKNFSGIEKIYFP